MARKTLFNPLSGNFDIISEVVVAVVGATPNANGASIDANQNLSLQPADLTNPGVVSTGIQEFGGDKTFGDNVVIEEILRVAGPTLANGGLDVSVTAGVDTLSIGTQNAEVINIGSPAAIINFIGTLFQANVTNLNVTDALITINDGGGTASGAGAGFEIEEGGIGTGYVKVAASRNSMLIKAPGQSGEATISPGSAGITLDQSSHDPLTLASVGFVPNANGASISGQQLTLQPADGTTPGLLTPFTQVIGGNKTFTNTLSVDSTTRLATSLTGPLKATSGTVSASAVALASEVSGVLPVANGGTNSGAPLVNGRIMVSASNAVVEAVALTNGQLLIGSTTLAPVAATITAGAGVSVTNGAGSITVAITVPSSAADIPETAFTPVNNQVSAANVTGLVFANTTRSFEALVSVQILATSSLYETFKVYGIQRGASWSISQSSTGDVSLITLSINSSGQVQYTSGNYAGFTSALIKFRATTLATS